MGSKGEVNIVFFSKVNLSSHLQNQKTVIVLFYILNKKKPYSMPQI